MAKRKDKDREDRRLQDAHTKAAKRQLASVRQREADAKAAKPRYTCTIKLIMLTLYLHQPNFKFILHAHIQYTCTLWIIPKKVNKQKKLTASELDQTLCTGCV